MKKSKNRSQASLLSTKSDAQVKEEIYVPPLDELSIKVFGVQVSDDINKRYAIKVTFFDQLLISGIIQTVSSRSTVKKKAVVQGTMNYDPSDYEKMCLFADCPLVVNIQPLKSIETNISSAQSFSPRPSFESKRSSSNIKPVLDISCCNVDILPIFLDKDKLFIRRRMEPLIKPSILQRKSWDNLPLISLELYANRNPENSYHHQLFKQANYMKLTLIGAFNVQIPYDDEYVYTAASNTPLHTEGGTNMNIVTYNQGYRIPHRFHPLKFYPKWESLRLGDDVYAKSFNKFVSKLENIENPANIDLHHYLTKHHGHHDQRDHHNPRSSHDYYSHHNYHTFHKYRGYHLDHLDHRAHVVMWGSFHRTLMLEHTERWLAKHLRRYSWPFEVHIYGEQNGLSFMAFLNLFRLLYPAEDTVRMAVPLHWINSQEMVANCGCDLLLTPNDNFASIAGTPKINPSSVTFVTLPPTGADDNCAFIIIEVKMLRPLKKAVIPPHITSAEILTMLQELEQGASKRECTGRGQLDRDWQSTVRGAEVSLRRVPHYGMTELCAFNRQLSETRTRVELMTSCWLEAAVYVNNNFVVQEFLHSEETIEEMLMMAHACMTRVACSTLVGSSNRPETDPTLKAARHARHMQDLAHAVELYLQLVVQKPRSANSWRELSTCLRDIDVEWADVCINKAVVLEITHPLNLVAKGAHLFEEDPEAAEPFFVALLSLYPFWLTGWIITSAYYFRRELFHMSDQVLEHIRKTHAEGLVQDITIPRVWDYELGDWWDHTPLLPGTNEFYDATDLLLRLRALSLAETCLARAIAETGDTAASYHLLAVCCRLRYKLDDALCHLQLGIEKFGDLSYLRGLQAECLHKKGDLPGALAAFEKAGSNLSAYSILLSMPCWESTRARSLLLDLIRRQPSAYAWLALAEDWALRATIGEGGDGGATEEQAAAKTCAIACAVQALKCDRQVARAWALLSRLVVPSARRLHCREMAKTFDFEFSEERLETRAESQQSLCHRLGRPLRECRCHMCQYLKF